MSLLSSSTKMRFIQFFKLCYSNLNLVALIFFVLVTHLLWGQMSCLQACSLPINKIAIEVEKTLISLS
jgi:hypothetical protein